ncbi:hypothetical protein NE237_023443 [Protea cynaroides]|uniref:Uncharacterized protein n=1 Tax=Protea cynaroides TaxID=273540 RepID=A0A9Q0HH46_9MAGN|nr:hypothetical protein NE237_023443 [Protea cynaroides]
MPLQFLYSLVLLAGHSRPLAWKQQQESVIENSYHKYMVMRQLVDKIQMDDNRTTCGSKVLKQLVLPLWIENDVGAYHSSLRSSSSYGFGGSYFPGIRAMNPLPEQELELGSPQLFLALLLALKGESFLFKPPPNFEKSSPEFVQLQDVDGKPLAFCPKEVVDYAT